MKVSDPPKCNLDSDSPERGVLPTKPPTNHGIFRKFHSLLFLLTLFSQWWNVDYLPYLICMENKLYCKRSCWAFFLFFFFVTSYSLLALRYPIFGLVPVQCIKLGVLMLSVWSRAVEMALPYWFCCSWLGHPHSSLTPEMCKHVIWMSCHYGIYYQATLESVGVSARLPAPPLFHQNKIKMNRNRFLRLSHAYTPGLQWALCLFHKI